MNKSLFIWLASKLKEELIACWFVDHKRRLGVREGGEEDWQEQVEEAVIDWSKAV